jgi:hypothetical protein
MRWRLPVLVTVFASCIACCIQSPASAAEPDPAATPAPPPPPTQDAREDNPNESYIYIGARYRGTLMPAFVLDAFLRNTQSLYFNSIGIEADFRRNGFSIIPNLTYSDYGTGNILFADKSRDLAFAGNWGVAKSEMKAIYAGVDLLWSFGLAKTLEAEVGFGVGFGAVIGDLYVNWVYDSPTGALVSQDGRTFAACQTVNDGSGCAIADHENATVAKVGGYKEPSWFQGGAKPPVLPFVAAPQLGLRWKPHRDVETRLGFGFSLTGFWFGLSADYAVKKPQP